MKNKNKKSKKNWLVFFLLGGFLLKLLFNLKKDRINEVKVNFLQYVEKEEKEVKKLIRKKETLKEFETDSGSLFRQYFVPCEANHFHPKLLQTQSLVLVVVLLMILKIAVAGYLFFVYPNNGQMAAPPREEILNLINADRKKLNLPALALNSELNRAALEKLNDMSANNYFAHNSPNGKKPWDWINRKLYNYTFAGENLAMDFTTSESVHKALMDSVTHRKNILNKKFENIGIAVAEKVIDGEKTNILVEMFGAEKYLPVVTQKLTEAKQSSQAVSNAGSIKTLAATSETKQSNYLPQADTKRADSTPPANHKAATKKTETVIAAKIAQEPIAPVMDDKLSIIKQAEQGQIELAVISQISERNISPAPHTAIVEKNSNSQFAKNLIQGSQYFYLFVFLALVILLSANILIRLSVQHKPVLVETLFTILIIIGFISTQAGYLAKLVDKVIIY
jgi:hypothetical protein